MSVLDKDTLIHLKNEKRCLLHSPAADLYSTHRKELTKEEGGNISERNPQSSIGPHKEQKSIKSIRA